MQPYYEHNDITIYHGDCRELLPWLAKRERAQLIVTSPPYNKAGHEGFIRTSSSRDSWSRRNIAYDGYDDFLPEPEYQRQQIEVLQACHDLLDDGGSVFYNHKPRYKDFVCTLPTDWILKTYLKLRQEIIWDRTSGPNVDPIKFFSTTERVYWLFKGARPRYFNPEAARYKEVWPILPDVNPHPAPFPEEIALRCVMACSRPGELVVDPYVGSGTTLRVARKLGRRAIGIEQSEAICEMAVQFLEPTIRKIAAPAALDYSGTLFEGLS
jgi:site-specific DNA-methyltransferase (adenine-specific)